MNADWSKIPKMDNRNPPVVITAEVWNRVNKVKR